MYYRNVINLVKSLYNFKICKYKNIEHTENNSNYRSRSSSIHKISFDERSRYVPDLSVECQAAVDSFKNYAPIADLGLNLYIFYDSISKDKTPKGWTLAITSFLLSYYSTSDLYRVFDIITNNKYVKFEHIDIDDSELDNLPEAQSGSVRKVLDNWKSLSESELLIKSQRVVFGLVTAGIIKQLDLDFTESSYSLFSDTNIKNFKFKGVNDMLYSVLDLVTTFAEVGYECFLDKSIQPLLISDRRCRTWLQRVNKMDSDRALDPITLSIDHSQVISDYKDLVFDGQLLLKSDSRTIIAPILSRVSNDMNRYVKKYNVASTRRPPFSVLLHGPPGQGKSTVIHYIANIFHKTVTSGPTPIYPDLPWDPSQNMYTRNPVEDFWNGYKGAKHWAVVLDDLAREHPRQVIQGQGTSILEVITTINAVGSATNQAAIEDKGTIPLMPKLVVATTNVKDLNAGFAAAEASAILRRLPYVIKVVLKPEYVDPMTGMMKSTDKVVSDAWNFEIETLKMSTVGDRVETEYVPLKPGDNISNGAELCKFLTQQIRKHELASSVMRTAISDIAKTTMCSHGVLSNFVCSDCAEEVEPQSALFVPALLVGSTFIGYRILSSLHSLYYGNSIRDRLARYRVYFFRFLLLQGMYYLPQSQHTRLVEMFFAFKLLPYCDIIGTMGVYLQRRIPYALNLKLSVMKCALGLVSGATLTLLVLNFFRRTRRTYHDIGAEAQGVSWVRECNNEDFRVPRTSQPDNKIQLVKSIRGSMFTLIVCESDGSNLNHAMAFSIGEGRYVTVNHLFESGKRWNCIARIGANQGKCRNEIQFSLPISQIQRLPNDMCVFYTASIIPRKSLWHFLPLVPDKVGRKIFIVSMDLNGIVSVAEGLTKGLTKIKYYTVKGNEIYGHLLDGERTDRASVRGDCGSLNIAASHKGYFIQGMHCAGVPNSCRILSAPLSQDLFKNCISLIPIAESNDFRYFCAGNKKSGKMGSTPQRSIVHWMDEGRNCALGSFPGRSTMQSRVKETSICKEVCNVFNYDNKFVAPLMKAVHDVSSDTWINPFTIAATKQSAQTAFMTDEVLYAASEEYCSPIIAKILEDNIDVSNLTVHDSINGIPGNKKINAIPMSTSGGFLFPGAKRAYFVGEPGFYSMSEEVSSKKQEIEVNYFMGKRACVLFNGALKDEPVTIEKRLIGKTRVFTACDVAFSLLVREHYLRAASVIMTHNILSECAVSMNHCSLDWSLIYDFITYFGDDKMVAGDYSSYDKGMPPNAIAVAFQVLDNIREAHVPFTPALRRIAIGIRTDIMFPITNLNGDVFQFFGGNSSGHPLTVIINSIVNSLYVRVAYHDLTHKVFDFRDNVHLMTYGDDNVFGSNIPTFNHTTLAEALRLRGIKYTMADKNAASVPFLPISRISFLKRNFVRSAEGDIIGPLDPESIMRMLCMEVQGDNISSEQRLAEVYLAARSEWCLHGQEVFECCTNRMDKIFSTRDDITRFFIKQHKYDYATTYLWVMDRLEEEQDEIVKAYEEIRKDDLAL